MAQADTRYLKRQYQSWYFVTAVPKSLRGRFISQGRHGRPGQPLTKIVVSLGTQSLSEAQERRWPLVHEWREKFQRAGSCVPLSLSEIEAEAREVYTAALEKLETEAKRRRAPATAAEQIEALSAALDQFIEDSGYDDFEHVELDEHIEGLADFDFIANELSAVQRRKGVTLEPGSPTYRLMGQAITRAIIDALDGRMKALQGKPSEPAVSFLGSRGIDPISLRPIAPAKRPQVRVRAEGEGMKFSEAAALYLDEIQRDKSAALTEQTRGQAEAVYRLFQDYSDDVELGAVTRAMASDFLSTIAKLHPHWGRSPQAKKMTLEQLLEQFGDKGEGLTNRTINRYVVSLSAVFKWARKRGHFGGDNPFADQGRKISEQRKSGWTPYATDELNALFSAPLFQVPTADRVKPRKHTIESALRWIPLIALYSGMRLGEICQLQTGDVRREGKVWFFNVTEEAEGQRVKTEAAIRRVPVHSMLVKCGFLDYLKSLPAGSLWPALKPGGPDAKLSWYLSKRFTEFRRIAGVDRPRVSFHSFRKNVATALDNASVNRGDIAALIGHERGFTLETYSGGKGLEALRQIAEKIKYPGLRLSHLQGRSQ